jgi:hypothetical protein
MQYAAYHFQIDDIRSIVPEGQELLMIGRWLAQRVPSIARHEVMHGKGESDAVEGACYVIAFDAPKNVRASIDEKFQKMRGYRGMKVIELGKTGGYDLVKGRIPKP